MAINKIPEMVTDAKVYEEGADNMIGVANIDMPEFSNMTTSIKGVGLAGEIDAPVKGHFQSLEMKINWRTPHTTALLMSGGKPVKLEIWANIQNTMTTACASWRMGVPNPMRQAHWKPATRRTARIRLSCTTSRLSTRACRSSRLISTIISALSTAWTCWRGCVGISA